MTGLMLRENGYQVLEARNGSEASDICREHQEAIHLVLTDQSLPGISGLYLVSRLAILGPGIKVILMSGFAVEGLGQKIADSMVGLLRPNLGAIHKLSRNQVFRKARSWIPRFFTSGTADIVPHKETGGN